MDFIFDVPNDLSATLGGWAPESEIGSDLQFFTARRNGVANEMAPLRKGKFPVLLAIAAITLVIVVVWALSRS